MSINKVILSGYIGKDAEARNFDNGGVINFSVATSESWKDKSGEWKEKTEWHNVVRYTKGDPSKLASILTKGTYCEIEGKLETRKWEKNGDTRYITEVIAGKVSPITPKKEKRPEPSDYSTPVSDVKDDLPF